MTSNGVWAELMTPLGVATRVPPGGIIGRLENAALKLNDPRISEAHAMVSLRRGRLYLLALRRITVEGIRLKEVALEPGLVIELAAPHSLDVLSLALPATVLGLESRDFERFVPPPVASFTATNPVPVPGFLQNADAVLWTHDGRFHLLCGTSESVLEPGQSFLVGDRSWRVVTVPLAELGADPTGPGSRQWVPLRITLRPGTVHIWSRDTVTALDGIAATIVHSLAELAELVSWQTIASATWPDESDPTRLLSPSLRRCAWPRAAAKSDRSGYGTRRPSPTGFTSERIIDRASEARDQLAARLATITR